MQSTKIQNYRNKYTKGNFLSVADLLSRSFIQKEVQLNQVKHKHWPPHFHIASLKQDNEFKPVHYLVQKWNCTSPTKKDNGHPIWADLENDQFSIRINENGKNIPIEPLDLFSFAAVKPFKSNSKEPDKKSTKTVLQKNAILNDADITDKDDPTEEKIPQNDDPFHLIYHWQKFHLFLKSIMTLKMEIFICKLLLKHIHRKSNNIWGNLSLIQRCLNTHLNLTTSFYLSLFHRVWEQYWNIKKEILFWKLNITGSLKIYVLL